jgi:hypothetical protein
VLVLCPADVEEIQLQSDMLPSGLSGRSRPEITEREDV